MPSLRTIPWTALTRPFVATLLVAGLLSACSTPVALDDNPLPDGGGDDPAWVISEDVGDPEFTEHARGTGVSLNAAGDTLTLGSSSPSGWSIVAVNPTPFASTFYQTDTSLTLTLQRPGFADCVIDDAAAPDLGQLTIVLGEVPTGSIAITTTCAGFSSGTLTTWNVAYGTASGIGVSSAR